jgi:hypothetical protein
MAGSYSHLRDAQTGQFRFDLIENLGDAYEACEECFFLIAYLTGNDQGRIEEAVTYYYQACRGEVVPDAVQAAFARLPQR